MHARVKTVVNGFFFENCYLVSDPGGRCIIIDPGDEAAMVDSMVHEMELIPVLIAATHAHIDFIGAVSELRDRFRVPFAVHTQEQENLERLTEDARFFGLPTVRRPTVDRWLEHGDELTFGEMSLEVIHTPGHTAGSVCYSSDGMLCTGDTIFSGGYGRTDLRGGDEQTLEETIKEKVFTLPDRTIIYPGHGPTTTVGEEKKTNWIVTRLKKR